MASVKALGYIGCNVSGLEAWSELLMTVFPLDRYEDCGNHTRHFSIDGQQRKLTLRQTGADALAYIGWEVGTAGDLREFEGLFAEKGIAVVRGDPALCEERAVAELIVLTGPDSVRTELFFGPRPQSRPSAAGHAGAARQMPDLQLGHIVLACTDRQASMDWYREVLGFKLSDHIFWDGVEATFLHCNPRHHSLALTNRVGDMRGGDLGHFMLEAGSMDDVGRAYDVVRKRGIPVAFTLGRHSNDAAFSFYVYTPSGWLVEYGYGGRSIDDRTWETGLYDAPSIWGHEMQPPPGGDQQKQRY